MLPEAHDGILQNESLLCPNATVSSCPFSDTGSEPNLVAQTEFDLLQPLLKIKEVVTRVAITEGIGKGGGLGVLVMAMIHLFSIFQAARGRLGCPEVIR